MCHFGSFSYRIFITLVILTGKDLYRVECGGFGPDVKRKNIYHGPGLVSGFPFFSKFGKEWTYSRDVKRAVAFGGKRIWKNILDG